MIFFAAASSCQKTEFVDLPPQLRFNVIDEAGNMVPDAKVKIYATYEDWFAIQNPIDSSLTDSTGSCLFTDLQEVYYFFDVEKGEDMRNLPNNSSIEKPLENGKMMNVTVILKQY